MTPLQQAATALLEEWGSPRMNGCLINLRTALADEQAQAVEPHGWMINGMSELMSRGHAQAVQTEHQSMGGTAVAYPVYLHPAPPPASTGERAELIAGIKHELAEFAHNKTLETLLLDAIEMLEADVSLINEGNKAQQVAVPLTDQQIASIAQQTQSAEPGNDGYILPFTFARAIEAHHGIGAKLEHKPDWSAA